MPESRRRTLRVLAGRLGDGSIVVDAGADRAALEAQLTALPGIGPWTAGYIALRGLGDPDVFLPSDLGVRRALERLGIPADPAAARRPGGGLAALALVRPPPPVGQPRVTPCANPPSPSRP